MVNGQCVLDGARLAREAAALGRMECSLYQRRNASKTEAMRQEFANGDFVRSIEYRRGAPAGGQRRPRQRERGKPDQIGILECKGRMAREIEPLRWPIDPFRPGQTVGDRNAHVGAAEMCN